MQQNCSEFACVFLRQVADVEGYLGAVMQT